MKEISLLRKPIKKLKSLLIPTAIYVLAYALGILVSFKIENVLLRYFVFDLAATVVTYVFSEILKNSSVYDPYWSLTPMVIAVALFIEFRAFSLWQMIFLLVFELWGIRLTVNWITVFTDFSYEDWRYRKFRAENLNIPGDTVNSFAHCFQALTGQYVLGSGRFDRKSHS